MYMRTYLQQIVETFEHWRFTNHPNELIVLSGYEKFC